MDRVLENLVLVVEDDFMIRRTVCSALEEAGYWAVGARDGEDALTFLRAIGGAPRLIVLDLGMSNMNGWELRERLLHHPHLRGVPIIVFSGHPHLDLMMKQLGAVAAIRKPFQIEALLDAVECQMNDGSRQALEGRTRAS